MAVKEEQPKIGLVAKLAEVMGLMRNVPKEGFNKAQGYRFVREDDVARMASALLAERKVWIHQSVDSSELIDLYKTQSGMTMRMATVVMSFRFIDGETGETTEHQTFVGTGADTGDKGIYKAMTGAEKYFLMKSFLISTGDDPEGDEKVDKAVEATSAAAGPRTTVRKADNGKVAKGGRQAMATDAQLAELKRMAKELGITTQTDMAEMVRKVLTAGGAKAEWADLDGFVAFIKAQTSVQMGALLVGVQALVDEATDAEPDDAVEDLTEAADDSLDLD